MGANELFGRTGEMGILAEALDRLTQGSAQVIHIVGEAGIGKSRLLLEARVRARDCGHAILNGGATEFERNYPFGVFVDALDRYLVSLDRSWAEDLGEDRARELTRIFPSLSAQQSQGPGALQVERFRAHDAVRELLEWLSERRPLVVTLDDFQWADAASIELLSHLLRRPPEGPVLILLAYRPHPASPQLAAVLEAVKRESSGGHPRRALELGPLDPEESQQLLGPELAGATRERIYRDSGGNPFYLEQLARTESRGVAGTGASLDAVGKMVPTAVAASIAGELEELSEHAASLLRTAAVVGEPFDPEVAGVVAELSPADTLQALDELAGIDLVRPAKVARLFRFRHPILRRAVYESVKPGWRIGAHRRAAEALRERGAPAVARADHVEQSASPSDEDAIALLSEAGHAAAPRAPSAAASWFAAALRLLPENEQTTGRRLELLVPLAVALGSVGRLEESSRTLREVLEVLPPEASALRTRAAYFAATVEFLLANQQRGEALLLEALGELGDQGCAESTRLKCGLALSSFFSADWPQMQTWSRRALVEARELEPSSRAIAVAASALATYGLGDVEKARVYADEAATLVDGLSDEALATRSESILFLGWAEHCLGRNEQVDRHMDRAIALSRATGQGHLMASMFVIKCVGLAWRGRLAEAATQAEYAVEAALLSANPLFKTWAFSAACFVETLRGDPEAAVRYGEEGAEAARSVGNPWSAMAPWCLAEAWLDLGEPGLARELVLDSDGFPNMPPFPIYTARCYETLTRAELGLGQVEAADRWAQLAQRAGEELGVGGQVGEGRRARATVLLASGMGEEAAGMALAAAAAAEETGAPVEAARSRALAGRALAEGGRRDQAIELLLDAESELARHGARHYHEQVAHELRRLGRRVAKAPASSNGNGVPALTPRQCEVAELVATGKTNRQIAEELYLSEKGVESHLSRIFDRLNVSSRTALAAMVERSRVHAEPIS